MGKFAGVGPTLVALALASGVTGLCGEALAGSQRSTLGISVNVINPCVVTGKVIPAGSYAVEQAGSFGAEGMISYSDCPPAGVTIALEGGMSSQYLVVDESGSGTWTVDKPILPGGDLSDAVNITVTF